MVSDDEELGLLSAAVEAMDTNRAQEVLLSLLLRRPVTDALALAESRIRAGLPWFLSDRPRDPWTEAALAEPTTPPPPDYEGPGENNFVNAIDNFNCARLAPGDHRKACQLVVAAVAGAIVAAAWHAYGTKHPEGWARWYKEAYEIDRTSRSEAVRRFDEGYFADQDVVRIRKEEWGAVIRWLSSHPPPAQ